MKIKVCTGSKCKKHGGEEIYKEMKDFADKVNQYIEEENLDEKTLKIKATSCQGACKHGPVVSLKSKKIKEAKVDEIKKEILDKYHIHQEKLI